METKCDGPMNNVSVTTNDRGVLRPKQRNAQEFGVCCPAQAFSVYSVEATDVAYPIVSLISCCRTHNV